MTLLLSLAVGMAFGAGTKILHLPLPAPNALPGVIAVAGVYFGAVVVGWL